MSRRNFWCMTRGDSSHLNFQLQKVDWEPSGRQNQGKMMEFWKILYIHFIRDPKGITYVRFILKIESDAKMRLAREVYILWHAHIITWPYKEIFVIISNILWCYLAGCWTVTKLCHINVTACHNMWPTFGAW